MMNKKTILTAAILGMALISMAIVTSPMCSVYEKAISGTDLYESALHDCAQHAEPHSPSVMMSSYIEDVSALPNVMPLGSPFKIYMELNTNTFDSVMIVNAPLGAVFHNGMLAGSVVLVDDGTQGDLIAGDSIYTKGGFTFQPGNLHPIYDQIMWRYTDIRYYTGAGFSVEPSIDLVTGIAAYDTTKVFPSAITPVNDTIQYSQYTINIKRPATWGEDPFPHWSWYADSDLFHDFFCYDLSYFLVQGTTNNMPIGTGSGASFGPSSNFTEGIGKSLVDLGLPFVGRMTCNWTRPMYVYTGHEFLHKWCAIQDLYGDTGNNEGITGYGHWAFLHMQNSGFVGPTSYEYDSIQHVNMDTFHVYRNYSNPGGFSYKWSNLELYMAGIYPIDSVPFPLEYLKNWEVVGSYLGTPITVTGTLETISEADWLNVVGPRVPAQGPTNYPTVQVIFSDELLDEGQMSYFDKGFSLSMDTMISNGASFYEVTDGLLSISSSLFPLHYNESVTICDGGSYNGYDETGIYVDSLTSSNGCDSIVTLDLTVITDDVFGDCCPDNLYADGDPLSSGTYQADMEVSSGETIEADSVVTFKGGSEVLLEPGFQVQYGASFDAIIDDCEIQN